MLLALLTLFSFSLPASDAVSYITKIETSDYANVVIETSPFVPHRVMLLTSAARERLKALTSSDDNLTCTNDIPDIVSNKYVFDVNWSPFTGAIDDGDTFYCYHFTCSDILAAPPTTIHVRNRWGYLPTTRFASLPLSWVETVFYIILLVLWIINRLHHKSQAVAIHKIMMVALIIQVITNLVVAICYSVGNSIVEMLSFMIIPELLNLLKSFIFLTLSLSLSSGVSIARKHLTNFEIAQVIGLGAVLAVMQFLLVSEILNFRSQLVPIIILLVVFCIVYGLYLASFYFLCQRAISILKAHMVMIRARGIDPDHTPTSRKIAMLKSVRNCGFAVFILFSMSTLIYVSGLIWVGILDILVAVSTAILYGVMVYRCRIRSKMTAVYGSDEDAYIVTPDDAQLSVWQPGMVLPPMPTEYHRKTSIHSGDPDEWKFNNQPQNPL
jgi:hypothetical protein